MVRRCVDTDFERMCEIINEAAKKYGGVIPGDCYHKPYMPPWELKKEMESGVVFYGYGEGGVLAGVMGIQDVLDVTLIRHAYVMPEMQGKGVGSKLIKHLLGLTQRPVLVGTWASAKWAIRFYEKHGFKAVTWGEKERLLRKYWKISERQVETSTVLADRRWLAQDRH